MAPAERGIQLRRDDPFALAERAGKGRLLGLLEAGRGEFAAFEDERLARCALLSDGGADRRDLVGRRSAASSDHARAELERVRGELAEVLRRRVRIDDAAAGEACEADVRKRGERDAVRRRRHLFERGERGEEPHAVVGPDRSYIELRQGLNIFNPTEGFAPGGVSPSRADGNAEGTLIRLSGLSEYRIVPNVTFSIAPRAQNDVES